MKHKTLLTIAILSLGLSFGSMAFASSPLVAIKLMRGSRGIEVSALQSDLNQFMHASLVVDGNFGMGTKIAVQAFQASKGLTPDGVYGPQTQTAFSTFMNASVVLPIKPVTPIQTNLPPFVLDRYNNQSVSVSAGQTLTLTLQNPGDGGYQFSTPSFNTSVLALINHVHTPSTNASIVGDWGTDTWTFQTLNRGTSALQIIATRFGDQGTAETDFGANITVQ